VDHLLPKAQAVAVLRDRIVAVGSNADVEAWRGPQTRVIDAQGKLLLPGFNDAHTHFASGGFQLESVQLTDATSTEEFVRRIAAQAKKMPKGEWMQGGDWDETKWTPAKLPTKEMIDAVTPDNPVFIYRYDGHAALANSLALKLAGVEANAQDPPGGVIVRDPQGNPTGIMKDAALDLVAKAIPEYTHEQMLRAVKGALAHAGDGP
jgi:predicted amidohydrolase YtcJ